MNVYSSFRMINDALWSVESKDLGNSIVEKTNFTTDFRRILLSGWKIWEIIWFLEWYVKYLKTTFFGKVLEKMNILEMFGNTSVL